MRTSEILSAFPNHSALVVGDICLDRWCVYDPAETEPSRETGIPRIGVVSTTVSPGAGGTIANNLASLGMGRVAVLGAIGEDGAGFELTRTLNAHGISSDLMVRSAELPTFTYTKLIEASTGEENLPRVDFILAKPLPENVEARILEHLRTFVADFDVVFVSDQAETRRGGVITPAVRTALADLARQYPKKVVWADSRVRLARFRNVILKANEREADTACAALFGGVDYQRLRRHAETELLIVTQGERGALVVTGQGETPVPGRTLAKPVDICGAGDAFSAGAAVALAITGSPVEAAAFGNLVAAITVTKKGTGTACREEVLAAANE
jgi:rfaE bifunctional protein kinase chain/domain